MQGERSLPIIELTERPQSQIEPGVEPIRVVNPATHEELFSCPPKELLGWTRR